MNTNQYSIHALQERAEKAARQSHKAPRRSKLRLSRSARLHLIDILSRWGGSGLALVAGIAIFIATTYGGAYPLRTAVWLIMLSAALFVCRKLRRDFRAGQKIASRPFRWRANYTSALSVLSAAFGAGALLTAPELVNSHASASAGPASGTALVISSLILLGAIAAGALHIAHGRSVIAMIGPSAFFVIAALWATNGAMVAFFGAAALVVAAGAGLFLASRHLQYKAAGRYPRAGFVRRGSDDRHMLAPAAGLSENMTGNITGQAKTG